MSVYTGLRFPMAVVTHLYIYICVLYSDTFAEFHVDTTSVGAMWGKNNREYMSVCLSVCLSVRLSVRLSML